MVKMKRNIPRWEKFASQIKRRLWRVKSDSRSSTVQWKDGTYAECNTSCVTCIVTLIQWMLATWIVI